jgi:hypothetical protein
MIKGKGVNELRKYRSELISRGIVAGEFTDEMFYGHHLFCIKDPDGESDVSPTNHSYQPKLREARTWYQPSLDSWKQINNPGARTPVGFRLRQSEKRT